MKILPLLFLAMLCAAAPAPHEELDLAKAQTIAARAAACGKKNGWKLSIAVVNAEGNLLYFQRGDGAYVGSIQASMDKARTANNFRQPTSRLAGAVRDGKVNLVTLGIAAVDGGVPIVLGSRHAGAIGVSGAMAVEDEQCALEAVK